jgi:hypothetical protein
MKLYAQYGYGPGDKVLNGFRDGNIDGVIFSARYSRPERVASDAGDIQEILPSADILLDPEYYASFYAYLPDAQLGGLSEWPFFLPQRRSQLETTEAVERVLETAFETLTNLPLTNIIAPNIFIPRSFDSIEAVIAKNFIRGTRPAFEKTRDGRQVFATLAVGRDTLLNQTEFEGFLNDITALDDPPDGFYVLVGGGMTEERIELTRSEIIHADVIAGWMLLNHTLSLNGFTVINGCSDIITPFLGGAGGYAGATGWWTNLRMFSMNRYVRSISGGRMPTIRYLSNLLLNRITFSEREAIVRLMPNINNRLPHDRDYEGGEPARNIEVLQTWEALAHLNQQLLAVDTNASLHLLENAVNQADVAYTGLSAFGLALDIEANREYINALREGIRTFRRIAEI